MKNKAFYCGCLSMLLLVAACSKGGGGNDPIPTPTPTPSNPTTPAEKVAIKINPSLSRATDTGFETGDRVGLYVVNYNGSTAGTLANSGNHVNNMRFSYSGTWTPDATIYWKDETTHADFYLYYPYAQVSSVSEHQFTAAADQSQESAYKNSDLMIGRSTNIAPTASAVTIGVSHVLSRININVVAGNGFTTESLAQSTIAVKINGVKTSAKVNLATSEVTATGDAASVTPLRISQTEYKAIIVPQSVDEGNLIVINVDSRDYTLKKSFTFESGKSHNFTVTLEKTSNGINVSINPWNTDGEDNGGTAV